MPADNAEVARTQAIAERLILEAAECPKVRLGKKRMSDGS
jgi:hypothetical protein